MTQSKALPGQPFNRKQFSVLVELFLAAAQDALRSAGSRSMPAGESEPKLLLTVEEAAHRLSVGRPKMYELIMRGEVLSVKIGASRRISTSALEEYVERLSADATGTRQATVVARRREEYGYSR